MADQFARLTALYRAGKMEAALELARSLEEDHGDNPAYWSMRGACARALEHPQEAEASFRRLEQLQPQFAGAPYNLALALEDQGRVDEAMEAYARALRIDPTLAQAHNNLGVLLSRQGEFDRALDHLGQAAQLSPNTPEVHNTLGNALNQAGRMAEARSAYERALAINPDLASAHYNLGVLEQERGDRAAAIAAFTAALEREPANPLVLTALLHQLAMVCDWEAMAKHRHAVPQLGISTAPVLPFPLLALEDNLERQSQRAHRWSEARYGATVPLPPPARPGGRPERLKLGYYSACYRDHPMIQLFAGLWRAHDRARFEVHAISCGPGRGEAGRRKAAGLVEHFHVVEGMSDAQIAQTIRELGIDILIDHDGHTIHNRGTPVAMRPAPVQINMVGFPGTLGTAHHDYIVADSQVVPDHARAQFSEKLLLMPHSYLPVDGRMVIANNPGTRAQHGLPETGPVLSCFNANWKLTSREFACWMRVLERVPEAVLWFRHADDLASTNLRRAAEGKGIDPARLLFAKRVSHPEHLARHAHADLLLDTFAYGSHTTAVDALLAGQLVVTKQGEQFSARTASSLLHAVGMDDMVTHSEEEYEALVVALIQDRTRLASLKERLAANLKTKPLFDTAAYARQLEAGFDAAYMRWLRGEVAEDIVVSA